MAWWDFLLSNPSTTAPIPPMQQFRPPGMFRPGIRDPRTAGLHQSIFGSPFIPTQFDEPNTFRPGAEPGQLDVAPKPPIPPMMGRNPMPAAMPPQPDIYQHSAPPEAYPGMRVDNPNFVHPGAPSATTSAAPKSPNWYERNKDWITQASEDLGALGRGMVMAPPGVNAYGYGFANVNDDRRTREDRGLKRQLLKAQVGEVESKAAIRTQAKELAAALPSGHPAKSFFALGLVEKGLEKLTPNWNDLIVIGPDGKPRMNETLVNAKAFIASAGAMKPQYGITGYDIGGKPIHGWVTPPGMSMPGAAPGAATQPGAAPGSQPPAAPTSAPPARAVPTQGTSPDGAIPPPPPGSDPYKWAEEQTKLRIQKQQGVATRQKQAPIIVQDIDRAIKMTDGQSLLGGTTGTMGALYRQIPGSPADQLNKMLDSVRANIGFDRLNQMRQESPTGAALGAVQVEELRMLQSVMGSLSTSQKQEDIRFNLRRLKNAMLDVIHGPGQGPAREKLEDASPQGKTGTTRGGLKYRVE